jgi:sporulation protein YlmC with PRC-barrel domain
MKLKYVIPSIALCMGSSLLVGAIRANDQTSGATASTSIDQKNTVNASQLLHSRVLDQSGQKIGDVEDIIVEQNSGQAQFAVIKLSGDLADNGKYAPIPFSLLKFNDMNQKDSFGHRDLTLQVDRQKLLSASRFSAKNWPDQDHPAWGSDVYAYYGVPWNGVSTASTGSSFSSSSGSSGTTYTATARPANQGVVVQETHPRTHAYAYRYEDYTADKPIDNGTGPDGRDTFHFTPRPWPYNEMQVGASGPAFSATAGSSDNTRVIVQQPPQPRPSDTVVVQNYDTAPRYSTDRSQVVVEDRYPARTSRTYTVEQYTSDKPIDNGTGPDGRDTFRFTPRPWPYHDTTDAH